MNRDSDTRPKDGDGTKIAAPLGSGAGPKDIAQTPSPNPSRVDQVIERLTQYVERTRLADADEQIDRDDIDEPSLTFGDIRALLNYFQNGNSSNGGGIEPTEAMIEAGLKALWDERPESEKVRAIYLAMESAKHDR